MRKHYEYFVRATHLHNGTGETNQITRRAWGIDEFDAANWLIKEIHQEQKAPAGTYRFLVCRFEPTGRCGENGIPAVLRPFAPVLPEKEHDRYCYTQACRAALYFTMAETVAELDEFETEAAGWLQRRVFLPETVTVLAQLAAERRLDLLTGAGRPRSFDLAEARPEWYSDWFDGPSLIRCYADKAADCLRRVGCRVHEAAGSYSLVVPPAYTGTTAATAIGPLEPMALILQWELQAPTWLPAHIRSASVLTHLGATPVHKEAQRYAECLMQWGVTPLLNDSSRASDSRFAYALYVLREEAHQARRILAEAGAHLSPAA